MAKESTGVIVGSVDKFQGKEKKLILMSAVRSNSRGNNGFLKEGRRLNVAITRVRCGILVFGNARTLHSGDDEGAWVSFLEGAAASGYLLCSDWTPMSIDFNTSHGATMESSIDCRESESRRGGNNGARAVAGSFLWNAAADVHSIGIR